MRSEYPSFFASLARRRPCGMTGPVAAQMQWIEGKVQDMGPMDESGVHCAVYDEWNHAGDDSVVAGEGG